MTSHWAPRRKPRDSSVSANWSERSCVPQGPSQVSRFVLVDPEHAHVRMEHEPLAHEAGRVREAVRVAVRGRQEQESRRSDAVRGDDHHVGILMVLLPRPIDVGRAGCKALAVDGDLAHARAGDELRAVREGRPATSSCRSSSSRPWGSPTCRCRCARSRRGCRPPRSESRGRPATSASRARSCPRAALRPIGPIGSGGSAGAGPLGYVGSPVMPGDLHVLVDPLVVRLHLLVRDRPVVGARRRPCAA